MNERTAPRAPDSHARLLAQAFGQIADTLDWTHEDWLALLAKLAVDHPDPRQLTLGQITDAIGTLRVLGASMSVTALIAGPAGKAGA